MATIHSRDLQQFHDVERALWKLFSVFGPLCGRCARKTLREHAAGKRDDRASWCCCMIDNQIHDHWDTLNPVQSHFDRKWYDKLTPLSMGRMPGNGPCPALGAQGCRLRKCRPVTCTTQLCSKMLAVLRCVGLYDGRTTAARQIEELLPLPDILHALYRTGGKGRKVTRDEVAQYIGMIHAYRAKFEAVAEDAHCAAIDAVLPDDGQDEEM